MARFHQVLSGMILLALIFSGGIVCAAEGDTANLSVSKVVSSAEPHIAGQPVIWFVTLSNNGPGEATNISLAENISGFSGQVVMSGVADLGTYNNTTRIWKISSLDNDTYTQLTIITVFDAGGTQTNNIDILGLDQASYGNRHADATVVVTNATTIIPDRPLSMNLVIRPATLNLRSKGVFTVFASLNGVTSGSFSDGTAKPRIDFANSPLTCGDAEMIRASVSDKDGGTLIAKFHRYDLENVTSGTGVMINCSGTISVNGTRIPVEGSDTIRVIGEKKGLEKVLSQLSKFLGIEKEDIEINESEDANVTVTFTLNPDRFKNSGQAKKLIKNQDTGSDTAVLNETAVSGQAISGKEKPAKNKGEDQQVRQNSAGDKPGKNNNGSDKRNDESPGNSNGKKTK